MKKIIFILALFFFIKGVQAQSFFMLTYSSGPALNVSPTSLSLGTVVSGTAGSNFTYTLTGTHLTANCIVTAPTGTEVSLNGSTFSNTVTVNQSGGNIGSTTIYARISSSASSGGISSNITNTSTGAPTVNVAVTGTVTGGTTNDTFNVQMWDSLGHSNSGIPNGKYVNAAWNNWSPSPGVSSSLISAALKDETGVTSPIHISVSAVNDYAGNGSTYGNTNTMGYPPGILVVAMYNTTTTTFTFTGVSAGNYKVEIVSSTSAGSGPFNQNFTSGAAVQNGVNAFNNLTTLVSLDNLSPTSGNITITITPTNSFIVGNALRLIRKN